MYMIIASILSETTRQFLKIGERVIERSENGMSRK